MNNLVKGLLLGLMLVLFLSQTALAQTTYTSVATGNWNEDATWSGSGIPGDDDNVIIDDGHTVTLHADTTIINVTVNTDGGSGGGELDCNGFTLSISGDLDVSGNWTSNGAVTFFGNSSSTVDFTGSGEFGAFTVNKTDGLDANDNVTLNDDINVSGTLTISDGELILGSNTLAMAGNMVVSDNGEFDNRAAGTVSWTSNGAYTVTSDVPLHFYDIVHSYSSFDGTRTLTFQQSDGSPATADFIVYNSLERGGQSAAIVQGTGADLQYNSATLIYSNTVNMNVSDEWPADTDPDGPDRVEFNGSSNRTVNIDDENVDANVVVVGSGTVDINTGRTLTVNTDGTLEVQDGLVAVNGTLTYNTGSTLRYNSSSEYAVNQEWTSSLTPRNLEIAGSGAELITNHTGAVLAVGPDGGAAADGDITFNAALRHDDTLKVRGDVVGGSGNFGVANNGVMELIDTEDTAIEVSNTFTVRNLTVNKTGGTATVSSGSTLRMDANSGTSNLEITAGTLRFNLAATALSLVNGGTHNLIVANGATIQTGGKSIVGFSYNFGASSTVLFSGNSNEIIPAASYGNVTVDNTNSSSDISLAGNITLQNNATLNVNSGHLNLGGITITNNSNTLTIGANGLLRTANASGTSDGTSINGFTTFNLSGELVFNGNTGDETIPAGVSGGAFDLTVNKSGGGVVMGGAATIGGSGNTLNLTNGIITTTTGNELTLALGTIISGGNASSHISGPVARQYNDSNTGSTANTDILPTGKGGVYRPVTLEFSTYDAGFASTVTAEQNNTSANPSPNPPTGFTDFYSGRHWVITESNTINSWSAANLTLDYNGWSPAAPTNVQIVNGQSAGAYSASGAYVGSSGTEVTHTLSSLQATNNLYAFAQTRATKYWVNNSGGDWNTGANWNGGTVPSPGDIVILDHSSGSLTSSYVVSISSADVNVSSLEITPDYNTATISLVISRSSTIPVTLSGSGSDILDVNARGILVINGPSGIGINMSNDGEVSFASGTTYYLNTGSGITSSGTRTFDSASVTYVVSTNLGALKAATYGDLNISNSSGTLSVTGNVACENLNMIGAGNATINGDFTVNGSLNKSIGAGTLTVSGGELQVTGTFSCTAGTVTSTGTGGFIDANSTLTNNGGTINFDGTAVSDVASTFTNTSGTVNITGSGGVTFNGVYDGAGTLGASSGSGAVTYNSTFGPDGNATFGSQSLILNGSVNIGGGVFTPSTNTTFAGALFETSGSGNISGTTGKIIFSGSAVQGVTDGSSASLVFNDVEISKTSNDVTLNSPVQLNGDLTLTQGDIITTLNLLTLGTGVGLSEGSDDSHINGPVAVITNSTVKRTLPIGNGTRWRRLGIEAITATQETYTAQYYYAEPPSFSDIGSSLDHISNNQYWTVSRSGSVNAHITLHWEDASDGVDDNLAVIVVAQLEAGTPDTWESREGSTGGDLDIPGSVRSDQISSFDTQNFTLGSTTSDNSLPVEMALFEAEVGYGKVTLNWKTASEINNAGFFVQRATEENGIYENVNMDRISSKADGGTSSHENTYSYVDESVEEETTYYYRIVSQDNDGTLHEDASSVVSVFTNKVPKVFSLQQNYPNPFNPSTYFHFSIPRDGRVSLVVYNALGQEVKRILNSEQLSVGEYRGVYSWDGTNQYGQTVSSGIYFFRLISHDYNYSKTMKMMFLK